MRDLHILPKFSDRWSHLYLEHGKIDRDASSLSFHDQRGKMAIPIDQLGLLMLGPGTSVTHAAMECLAENNCLVCWTGENGVRLYSHSTGGTHRSFRLLRQATLYSDEALRLQVVRRMYQKRFPEPLTEDVSLQQIRGMEGSRVRMTYQRFSETFGVPWTGRNYDQDNWDYGDPVNRALSTANSCLYGLCHAAIISAGYSPAIGFVHTGKMLSFVYDVADLYKTETVVPIAFQTVKDGTSEVERRTRLACRDLFFETRLMQRILPDIAEVLDARDDLGESPGELDGRAITLADSTQDWDISRQSERAGSGRAMGDGDEEGG